MSFKSSRKSVPSLVSKATGDRNIKPPKEKYIDSLCLSTFGGPVAINELIGCLSKRLEKSSWIVITKTLMIFHRCLREGDQNFVRELVPIASRVFTLKSSSLYIQNNLSSLLAKKYARYIEEQVSVFRMLGFNFEKNVGCFNEKISIRDYLTRVFKLQSQFNALLNCRVIRQHYILNNPLLAHFYILLSKDTIVLYPMLSKAVMFLVEKCFTMKKKEAARILEIYVLFVKETNGLIGFYSMIRPLVPHLPTIMPPKTEIISSMVSYVGRATADNGTTPSQFGTYEKGTIVDINNFDLTQNTSSNDLFQVTTVTADDDNSTSSESFFQKVPDQNQNNLYINSDPHVPVGSVFVNTTSGMDSIRTIQSNPMAPIDFEKDAIIPAIGVNYNNTSGPVNTYGFQSMDAYTPRIDPNSIITTETTNTLTSYNTSNNPHPAYNVNGNMSLAPFHGSTSTNLMFVTPKTSSSIPHYGTSGNNSQNHLMYNNLNNVATNHNLAANTNNNYNTKNNQFNPFF